MRNSVLHSIIPLLRFGGWVLLLAYLVAYVYSLAASAPLLYVLYGASLHAVISLAVTITVLLVREAKNG